MRWTRARKLRFLKAAPVIRVATVNRGGQPHVTPVCHVEFKGRIYWASDPDSAKVANLAHRRTVALVADVYKASWRDMGGVMAQGRAKLIREGPLFRRIRSLLYRKFTIYRSNAPFDERESVIIEVTPSRLVHWWYASSVIASAACPTILSAVGLLLA